MRLTLPNGRLSLFLTGQSTVLRLARVLLSTLSPYCGVPNSFDTIRKFAKHMHFTLRAKHFAVVPVTKVLDSCTQVEENIQLLRQEARARRDVLVGLASDSVNNVWTRRYSLGVRAVI